MEIWKSVLGYEGYYQVSNKGRVRSITHEANHSRTGKVIRTGKILAQHADADGYLEVNLSKCGEVKQFRVHRLVCSAFLNNPNNLPVVNHKDLNKTNNCVENLEWCTQQYNVIHAICNGHKANISKSGRKRIVEGAKKHNSKPIKCITTGQEFESVTAACKQLSLSPDTIIRSAKNAIFTRSGLKFKYIVSE